MNDTCSVDGCTTAARKRGWCLKHYMRWRRHGDPTKVGDTKGPANGRWKGDAAKYSAVHNRLRRYRGAAADHTCQRCDKAAEDWAYDRTDPNELVDEQTGFPYSTDLAHYLALCKPCHYQFDRQGVAA